MPELSLIGIKLNALAIAEKSNWDAIDKEEEERGEGDEEESRVQLEVIRLELWLWYHEMKTLGREKEIEHLLE